MFSENTQRASPRNWTRLLILFHTMITVSLSARPFFFTSTSLLIWPIKVSPGFNHNNFVNVSLSTVAMFFPNVVEKEKSKYLNAERCPCGLIYLEPVSIASVFFPRLVNDVVLAVGCLPLIFMQVHVLFVQYTHSNVPVIHQFSIMWTVAESSLSFCSESIF